MGEAATGVLHNVGNALNSVGVAASSVGIDPENEVKIFSHGFTTRAEGHGLRAARLRLCGDGNGRHPGL